MGGSGRVRVTSGDKRLPAQGALASTGGETEKCPRCGSHNTKFCYYNNYNLTQPRHFCKACRRYWTLGGTLRNVPIGGSTRRATQHQSKQQPSAAAAASSSSSSTRRRAAPVSAAASPSSSSSPPLSSLAFDAPSVAPLSVACKAEPTTAEDSGSLDAIRSFESLLTEPLPAGFLALGEPFLSGRDGFGLGLGLGGGPAEMMDEISFGIGKSAPAWPFFGDDDGSMVAGNSSTAVGGVSGIDAEREAWEVVGSGADGGDCFGWPELAMWMTPEKGMK